MIRERVTLQMQNWANTLVLFCFFIYLFFNKLSAILLTLFNPKINSSDCFLKIMYNSFSILPTI